MSRFLNTVIQWRNLFLKTIVRVIEDYGFSSNNSVNKSEMFVTGIEDRTERLACLQQAEEEGLDIPLITKTVVENIRHRDTTVIKADANQPPETTISEVC